MVFDIVNGIVIVVLVLEKLSRKNEIVTLGFLVKKEKEKSRLASTRPALSHSTNWLALSYKLPTSK